MSNVTNVTMKKKITVDETGIPVISKPMKVTIMGDVPEDMKLHTDEHQPSFIFQNKWQEAQRAHSPFGVPVVNESEEDS